MSPMLPTSPADQPRLADVLGSVFTSLQGADNPLELPGARSAVVVMVDGLGARNLEHRRAHARTAASALDGSVRSTALTTTPSTTATALASFSTGLSAGQHGIVGYSVRTPVGVVKQLSELDRLHPDEWQPHPTLFEMHASTVNSHVFSERKLQQTGFTQATLRGATYSSHDSFEERFAAAVSAVRNPGSLAYVYFPELDRAAHKFGWMSAEWVGLLEDFDAAFAAMLRVIPKQVGVIVTADHGMVDVASGAHVELDAAAPDLIGSISAITGDPRMRYLYLPDGNTSVDRQAFASSLQEIEGERALVLTREQFVASGALGVVRDDVLERIGDVVLIAQDSVAYFDSSSGPRARHAVGQHGAFTEMEMDVPLLRFGSYS